MAPNVLSLVCFTATLSLAPVVLADQSAASDKLFYDGLEQMKAGQYDQACPKFAESLRLQERPGTLFTLAECWNKAGRLASALTRYEEYLRRFARMGVAEQKGQRGRDEIARKQVDTLTPKVPQLRVRLAPDSPADTKVELDGTALGKPALDTDLPVDPGERVLTARAKDGREVRRAITLAAGEREVVVLELPPARATVPPRGVRPQVERRKAGSAQRTAGYVSAGVGAAGLVVGTVAGILVFTKKSAIDEQCGVGGDPTACSADGKATADSAQSLATVSTVGFAIGVVGLGAGAALIFTAPDPRGHDASGASVALSGRF